MAEAEVSKAAVAGIECRHVVHIPANEQDDIQDTHLVKEVIHLKDGRKVPNLRRIVNYKRPFWVTQKAYRDHKQRKDYEKLERLKKFECTQSQLPRAVAKALDKGYMNKPDLRTLKDSPYLYGVDVDSRQLIARQYQEKFKDSITPTRRSVAALDIETDMLSDDIPDGETGEIIMASLTFGSRARCVVRKSFVADLPNYKLAVDAAVAKHLGKVIQDRNISLDIRYVDSEYQLIKQLFEAAHEWKPDWISIWNIEFEMRCFEQAAQREQFSLKNLLSDPALPVGLRKYFFKPGKAQRITASGKFTPVKPHNRWPNVEVAASFRMIDAMCVYRQIRLGQQEEPSYSLNAILAKNNLPSKLNIEEASAFSGPDWHVFMQSKYKAEYIAYNIFDCIALEMLDEKTTDLSSKFGIFSKGSDAAIFGSQPSKTAEDFHHYCLSQGYVLACCGTEMEDELDQLTLPLSGWIIALQAHLTADNGIELFEDMPKIRGNVRVGVADLDISSSYPNGQKALNISKSTTKREVIGIQGFDEFTMRMQGMNLSGGYVNAIEFCTTMLDAATPLELLAAFKKEHGLELDFEVPQKARQLGTLKGIDDDDDEDRDPFDKARKILTGETESFSDVDDCPW